MALRHPARWDGQSIVESRSDESNCQSCDSCYSWLRINSATCPSKPRSCNKYCWIYLFIGGALLSAYQLSSCNGALAGNVAKSTLSYNGDRFRFSLGFAGGDFDSDQAYLLSGIFGDGVLGANGVFAVTEPWWSWQISVNEDAGVVNDVLSINGFITHVLPDPHVGVDVAAAPPLNFNLIVDADDAVSGKVSDSEPLKTVSHPSNVDPSQY